MPIIGRKISDLTPVTGIPLDALLLEVYDSAEAVEADKNQKMSITQLATSAAFTSTYQSLSDKNFPDGYAGLDGSGKIPASLLPAGAFLSMGTEGQLPYMNATDDDFDYGGIVFDGTNLGINKTVPTSKLDVDGDISILTTATNQLLLPQNNDATNPTLLIGSSGLYEISANNLAVSLSGANTFEWIGSSFRGTLVGSPAMVRVAASTTSPSFIPNRGDFNTGLGWAAADKGSLIAGGFEMFRFDRINTTNYSYAVIDATAVSHDTSAEWKDAYDSNIVSGAMVANDLVLTTRNNGDLAGIALGAFQTLQEVTDNDNTLTTAILSTASGNTFGSTTFDGFLKLNDNKNLTFGTNSDITIDYSSGTSEFIHNTALSNRDYVWQQFTVEKMRLDVDGLEVQGWIQSADGTFRLDSLDYYDIQPSSHNWYLNGTQYMGLQTDGIHIDEINGLTGVVINVHDQLEMQDNINLRFGTTADVLMDYASVEDELVMNAQLGTTLSFVWQHNSIDTLTLSNSVLLMAGTVDTSAHQSSVEWENAYDSYIVSGSWNAGTDSIDFISRNAGTNNFSVDLSAFSDPTLQEVVDNDPNLTTAIISTASNNDFGSTDFFGTLRVRDNINLAFGNSSDVVVDYATATNELIFDTVLDTTDYVWQHVGLTELMRLDSVGLYVSTGTFGLDNTDYYDINPAAHRWYLGSTQYMELKNDGIYIDEINGLTGVVINVNDQLEMQDNTNIRFGTSADVLMDYETATDSFVMNAQLGTTLEFIWRHDSADTMVLNDAYLQLNTGKLTGTNTDDYYLITANTSHAWWLNGTEVMSLSSAGALQADSYFQSSTGTFRRDSNDYMQFTGTVCNFYVGSATIEMQLQANGDLHTEGTVVGKSATISDIKFKNIDRVFDDHHRGEYIKSARDVIWKWNRDSPYNGLEATGLIAQDLEAYYPFMVEEKTMLNGVSGLTIDSVQVDGIWLSEFKWNRKEHESKDEKIARLEERVQELESRL